MGTSSTETRVYFPVNQFPFDSHNMPSVCELLSQDVLCYCTYDVNRKWGLGAEISCDVRSSSVFIRRAQHPEPRGPRGVVSTGGLPQDAPASDTPQVSRTRLRTWGLGGIFPSFAKIKYSTKAWVLAGFCCFFFTKL